MVGQDLYIDGGIGTLTATVSGMNVSAALDAVFEGGAGSDTFEDFGISGGTRKDVKEFEILLP